VRVGGHHALVTGGGTEIGKDIGLVLAEAGAKVSLLGRRVGPLEELAEQIGEPTFFVSCDVTDAMQMKAAMQAARDRHGHIEILVNNAGAAAGAPFHKLDTDDWHAAMAVNCDAVFHCTRAVIEPMLNKGRGRIVTIASNAGLRGYAYVTPYCAAKHAVVGLMRALAEEYGAKGINANAICPGFVDTDIVAGAIRNIAATTGRDEDTARAELARMNPSGRIITPEGVAAAVVDLIQSERNGEALEIA